MDTIIHRSPSTLDAIEELRGDHRRIDRVLADCERLVEADAASSGSSSADRSALVSRMGALLQAHIRVKHALFEPALRAAASSVVASSAAQDSASAHAAGHDTMLARLAALSAAEQRPGQFTEALSAFASAWRQHVQDEEAQAFPVLQAAADAGRVDLQALGTAIAQRRGTLLGDQGVD